MNYLEILKHSYEVEKSRGGCPPESPLEYLGESIFDFATYDGEMSVLFARKAVEVCDAINNGTTFDYIKDSESLRWYLLMCNTSFFADKLEWGTSIRGAWWNQEITFQSCGLWNGDEQLADDMKFTKEEWKRFTRAISDFANVALTDPAAKPKENQRKENEKASMKIKQAIEELSKLPPEAELMVADLGIGGSVPVEGFEKVSETWVDVMWNSQVP